MAKKDYYEILGVTREADEREIKKAYKRLAMKHHPDRNQGDKESESKFKEIKEAYEILTSPEKKAAYDQYGHAAFEQGAGGPGGFSGGFGGADFGDIFGDVFGDIFGGGRRQQQSVRRGADLEYSITLTLEEAVKGVSKEIRVPTHVECDSCHGSGAAEGSSSTTCTTCNGAGQVQMRQGFFAVQQTCPTCHGSGKIIKDPCKKCHGQGRVKKNKTLDVKIPAGVDNGDRIRLNGEGEAGAQGGPSGDLYVQISVRQHTVFERQNNDLHCEVPISITLAALGGEIQVPTLDGRISLKIPAETQTGKVFRIRGKGVKSVRSSAIGDLFCHIVIETPVKLNAHQKDLLKQLQDSFNDNEGSVHSPKSKSFFDKVKKIFD